jgi:hypothetical protein
MPLNPHNFHPNHIAAGYDQKQWKIPSPGSSSIGTYSLPDKSTLVISWVEKGTTGQPQLLLDFIHGPKLEVLDENTALEYVKLHHAVKS